MNQQLYQQLLDAGNLLAKEDESKNDIRKLQAKIKENAAAIDAAKKKIHATPKGSILLFILGGLALVIGIPTAVLFIVSIFVTIVMPIAGDMTYSEMLPFMGIFLGVFGVPCLIFIVVGIVLLVIGNIKKKKATKKARETYIQLKAENEFANEEMTNRINQIADDFVEYWNRNVDLLSFLPDDYRTLHAVGFMLKAVKNLRADTLKEAINLYDQELKHLETMAAAERQRLQNEELLYTMELLNLNMETMNANQERANRKLDDISFMQTMQIFDD